MSNPSKSGVITFSEGNTFVRVLGEHQRQGRLRYSIGMLIPLMQTLWNLLFWIDSLRLASAKTINVVVPFFSYAKGDKKDEPRVSIRAMMC